jgi:phosphotransacetylase
MVLSGCAGYTLGPTNGVAAGERSVQVTPFINRTLQPRLSDPVTEQVRKEFQRDGTYRLVSNGEADIIVTGAITKYDRGNVTYNSSDVLLAQDYRLTLIAQVKAHERSTGKVIFEGPITGSTLIRVGPDLTSAERQAMTLLAADFAKNLTAQLVQGKW